MLEIMEISGHKDLKSLQHYLRTDAKEVFEKALGRHKPENFEDDAPNPMLGKRATRSDHTDPGPEIVLTVRKRVAKENAKMDERFTKRPIQEWLGDNQTYTQQELPIKKRECQNLKFDQNVIGIWISIKTEIEHTFSLSFTG